MANASQVEHLLTKIIRDFVTQYKVSCPEAIMQLDNVNEALPELAEACFDVVGYYQTRRTNSISENAMLRTARRKRGKNGVHRLIQSAVVIAGRKRLAKLQRQGKEAGFISIFARRHGLSTPAAWSMLRGLTYKDLPYAVHSPVLKAPQKRNGRSKRSTRR